MTGLRQWVRDPELPARCGEPHLAPPTADELKALVVEHALVEGQPEPDEVTWEYARWKPGVSITCTYRLRWNPDAGDTDEGHEQIVVAKRYAGDKVAHLAERKDKTAELQDLSPRVKPRVLLPERAMALWCPAADRELPGVAYLLDVKRFASLVKNSGITEPGLIRRRKSEYAPLRYKAERRAVFRAKLKLRDEARTRITLAARVLPIEEAQRIAAARRALELSFEAAGLAPFVPRLLGFHDRYGILIEEWLDVAASPEPGDFSHAREAGAILAQLHALPVVEELSVLPQATSDDLRPLFAVDPTLAERFSGLHASTSEQRTWIHGDFHPDQVTSVRTGEATTTGLLDLDRLAPGDPTTDLANWIADHLFEDEERSYAEASSALLEGYAASGGSFDAEHLQRQVADELVRRGAATLRRLEDGALARAARCLERAASLA